jgi:flagellar hook-associated protein 2
MASTTSTISSTNSMSGLDSTYQTIITNLMNIESQPLTALSTKRDTLSQMKGVYTDLQTSLDSLLSAVRPLRSSDPFYNLNPGRKISITNQTSGSTVLSAAVNSNATPGSYNLTNIVLAKTNTVQSDPQTYSDQELGFSGDILIGGYANREIGSFTGNTVLNNAAVSSSVDSGQQELGTGSYYIETRTSSGTKQFRVVNADGTAQSIRSGSDSTVFTSGWQSMPATGSYDTGRGLSINFTGVYAPGTKGNGAAVVSYKAKGTTLSIEADDSLIEIASKINNATYASGSETNASVVNGSLILSSILSGKNHPIIASGTVLDSLGITSGGTFKYVTSSGSDASFKVNGISVTRSQNTNLSDVINGVTINLASDADGKTATINVTGDTSSQKSTINDFLTKFNSLQTYLTGKTAVTKGSDGTYTRGSLAGDSMVNSLKSDLSKLFTASSTNSGSLSKLRDIGITLDENNKAVISDSTKLENALTNKFSDVKSLLDSVMGTIYNKLSRYSGSTSGYITSAISSTQKEMDNANNSITDMSARLKVKQQQLIDQYASAQTTITMLTYQQTQMAYVYNSMSSAAATA